MCLSPDVVKHTGNFTVTKQICRAVATKTVSLLYTVRNWARINVITHGYYLKINQDSFLSYFHLLTNHYHIFVSFEVIGTYRQINQSNKKLFFCGAAAQRGQWPPHS